MFFKPDQVKKNSLEKLLEADDFYYNFSYWAVKSPNNPEFFIEYVSGSTDPERPKADRFMFHLEDFDIMFQVNEHRNLEDTLAIQKSYHDNGFMTLPIAFIGRESSHEVIEFHKNPDPEKSQQEAFKGSKELAIEFDLGDDYAKLKPIEQFEFLRRPKKVFVDTKKFINKTQQDLILEIFKKAMLAFPAAFELEAKYSLEKGRYLQTAKEEGKKYGAIVEYSDALLMQINNGALIK